MLHLEWMIKVTTIVQFIHDSGKPQLQQILVAIQSPCWNDVAQAFHPEFPWWSDDLLFAQVRAPTVRGKTGKSGNSEITLPALESQGIPNVLFKIQEKSVNSVSSRQHQNNYRRHLFPVLTVHSRFCGPILHGPNLTGSHYGLSALDINFPKSLWYQCNLSRRVRLRQPQQRGAEFGVYK